MSVDFVLEIRSYRWHIKCLWRQPMNAQRISKLLFTVKWAEGQRVSWGSIYGARLQGLCRQVGIVFGWSKWLEECYECGNDILPLNAAIRYCDCCDGQNFSFKKLLLCLKTPYSIPSASSINFVIKYLAFVTGISLEKCLETNTSTFFSSHSISI